MQEQSQKSPDLFELIGRIESNNNASAMRFEPKVYERETARPDLLDVIVRANNCSRATAKMIYSTSWGAVQMMGFNLYDRPCGYKGSIADFFFSNAAQRLTFENFCNVKMISYTPIDLANIPEARMKFAKRYNGAEVYLGPMCDALRHYGFTIIAAKSPSAK